jgi:hypothetical protein
VLIKCSVAYGFLYLSNEVLIRRIGGVPRHEPAPEARTSVDRYYAKSAMKGCAGSTSINLSTGYQWRPFMNAATASRCALSLRPELPLLVGIDPQVGYEATIHGTLLEHRTPEATLPLPKLALAPGSTSERIR